MPKINIWEKWGLGPILVVQSRVVGLSDRMILIDVHRRCLGVYEKFIWFKRRRRKSNSWNEWKDEYF